MEFRESSLRTCSICETETCNEEVSTGVVLSVHLPTIALSRNYRAKLNLQEILNQYFTSGDVKAVCSKCQTNTVHRRKIGVADHPEFLLIHAKLFYFEEGARASRKLNVFIEPDDLSLVAAERSGMNRVHYRIYAVVAHVGDSISCGHYLTIACGSGCSARIPSCGSRSGCWWMFDDNEVTGPMSKQKALGQLTIKNVSFYLY